MKNFRKYAAVVFMGLSLLVAVPSSAEPAGCPNGWSIVGVEAGANGDDNGNGLVCSKSVGGNGNHASRSVFVDERS